MRQNEYRIRHFECKWNTNKVHYYLTAYNRLFPHFLPLIKPSKTPKLTPNCRRFFMPINTKKSLGYNFSVFFCGLKRVKSQKTGVKIHIFTRTDS